ncbi:CPBP family intramembrane glutamic endopeptidase [Paenibacillus eucommiae]|uniref:Membrane protease YdiL (CAAX protease family) n=1 Tax=Paenibacillus eucommiae TaxID=1355755 RepID=A0ABS4IUZ1_9BACL|nr:CPBP family intramembrane glutamic endopeptidase [Paenibacillus eucommiae]MBP1991395.1 membrane protease YdiL (CAAX protease family) [Paenibacillus eucommiae]
MIVTIVIPLIILPYSKLLREKVAENYDEKLYPVTSKQQFMFIFVSIIVGICEEIIFRGFMYTYIRDLLSISPWGSFLIVTIIFGLGHFMQGVSGMVSSSLFGLIMGYFYFTTGSLLVPILIHIAYDMKAIFITRVLQKHAGEWKITNNKAAP